MIVDWNIPWFIGGIVFTIVVYLAFLGAERILSERSEKRKVK